MEQATAGQIQNQNQRQPQINRQAVPATVNSQPDELKGLGMMMQQLLQGQQVQAKALNQVTTKMDTRMGNMFTELNNKYDTLAIHIRKIDVQLAQTAEKQPFAETVLGAEENREQSASSGATAPSEPAETLPVRVYVPKVPYPIPPKHMMDPISAEQLAGFRKMSDLTVDLVLDGQDVIVGTSATFFPSKVGYSGHEAQVEAGALAEAAAATLAAASAEAGAQKRT
ncbi:hypothetical protein F2Q69_00030733 [Brassica cretica]|uniref:Uncharacterized protein n=1 Tax=Brassica cretica TaxID=69181 RepID=A0A8S9SC40_BRACR|nr:hypothetical protein F2Q69_00030733 [Brassica cretica]